MTDFVFCVQDKTGTAAQLEIADHPTGLVEVGDTGTYQGDNEGDEALPFTVGQVLSQTQFGITTSNAGAANWAETGTVTWLTGANATTTSTVIFRDGANAYITPEWYLRYHHSRGNVLGSPLPSDDVIQASIVRATDYLDNKFRYKGFKLLQVLGGFVGDAMFADQSISPYGIAALPYFATSSTSQSTQWPRQGVSDNNGDMVVGIPFAIMAACAELALRDQNGVSLQPDYDVDLVSGSGVVSAYTETVGPISISKTFATHSTGEFASFPQVDGMLQKSGLLLTGSGRTTLR